MVARSQQDTRGRLLQLLRDHGGLHRADLARHLGISKSRVSTIVAELIAHGLVTELEPLADGTGQLPRIGRPGLPVTLSTKAGIALGVDFSSSHARVVLVNPAHEVIAEAATEFRGTETAPSAAERLDVGFGLIDHVMAETESRYPQIIGVGLSLPDPLGLRWTGPASLPAAHPVDEIHARLGLPVAVDPTAYLAALAEAMWGAGREAHNLLYLRMSYGVDAGLLLGGQIFRGAWNNAGEIGHVSIADNGPVCKCGHRGCLRLYAGIHAIQEALRPALGPDITLDDIIKATHEGDRACHRVITDVGTMVGHALVNTCNLLNPERIIIGGPLAEVGEPLLDPIRTIVDRYALKHPHGHTQTVPAQLGERAGVLGAVGLVLREPHRLVAPPPPYLRRQGSEV